ncbi:MAG: ATP-dependent Clp protease proteolytic subunit [Sphingobacteriia bacterium]|jgi:ATP-dependent Clp protease protease subunit|nr:ATP-dependent Clp protease proteolytic subunit [Sphingobacteriia bacterium]
MGRSIAKATKSPAGGKSNSIEELMMMQNPYQGADARLVVLHGEVNEQSICNVIVQLLQLANQNHKPIHLVLSTYGGSVDEMFSLYDTIRFLPCPVHTIALGKVMSAGVLLLASGVKGKRMIGRSARIMIHPISGGIGGNVFEAMNEMKEFERLQELMSTALQNETTMKKDEIDSLMKAGHDCFLTPEQAIKMGIVDKIIGDK